MTEAALTSRAEPPEASFEKLKPGPGKSAEQVTEHQCERIQAAMLQIVAERGYPSVTVRELARVAGISSRTFYQRYSGKEECFLRTHESIARGIARRVAAAQAGEVDWRRCLRATIDTYLVELQREPLAARLLLIDAYVAGSEALEQVRCAERTLESRIVDCFELGPHHSTLPSQLARGIAVGVMCVARFRLSKDNKPELTQLTDELTSWVAAIFKAFRADVGPVPPPPLRSRSVDPSTAPKKKHPHWAASDERGLIVSALAKLAGSEGYQELTVRKVRASAGASRKKFNMHFEGIGDCFQEAVDLYTSNIVFYLDAHQGIDYSMDWRSEDPVALLCDCVTHDSALATLGFVDVFCSGAVGVHSLEQFINGIVELLAGSGRNGSSATTALEASAAAMWGTIREEVLSRRRSRLPEIASLLRIFAAVSAATNDTGFRDDESSAKRLQTVTLEA